MFWVDTAILIGSVLLFLGVLSSKFSSQVGMPALVMFLGLGMLAGSEGIGGIAFENYSLAYGVGTVVLAIILFSGGLATPLSSVRNAWRPAGILATLGVLFTAIITGLSASWILGVPWGQGLLLGCIVGSTDASAVFSILRAGGIHIRRTLADTLEIESGSNDPMAIFLTLGVIQYLTGELNSGWSLVALLTNQVVMGAVVGVGMGFIAVWALNRIWLDVAGLYPIMAISFGLMSYGLAADTGGSGYLSTYITGVVIGNQRAPFHRGIQTFHDATAWLCQIVMFILLGLLSFPSRLLDVIVPGLLISAVLMVFARPLAVYACLLRARFSNREKLFLSWVGLKGAVPITLAIFPLMSEIQFADKLFNVVFFVVLISAVVQGGTLKWVANWLKLDVPPRREPPVTLEISSLHDVEADIVDYFIERDTRVAGKMIRELALPEEVVVALVVRNHHSKLPKGSFRIDVGDHVIVVVHRSVRPLVDIIFSRAPVDNLIPKNGQPVEFPLRGDVKLVELEGFYSIKLNGFPEWSLSEWILEMVSEGELVVGTEVAAAQMLFTVRQVDEAGNAAVIGMSFLPDAPSEDLSSQANRGAATSPTKMATPTPLSQAPAVNPPVTSPHANPPVLTSESASETIDATDSLSRKSTSSSQHTAPQGASDLSGDSSEKLPLGP